jgi:hypothetical protein
MDYGEGWVVVVFDVAQELVCAQCLNGDILSLELKTSEVCWFCTAAVAEVWVTF